MKIRVRKPGARYRAKKRWHDWFAWRPVRVPSKGKMSGQTLVWFETIQRRIKYHGGYGGDYYDREYRFKK